MPTFAAPRAAAPLIAIANAPAQAAVKILVIAFLPTFATAHSPVPCPPRTNGRTLPGHYNTAGVAIYSAVADSP